ncbi:ABSCISIC ACID-INSENSITIVE 5-like protein 1 [Medicago truncatula]|uniref:BZIP transcription factor n=1 Tax=Medicago truncatula TaxID=3880 RepID=G7ITR9_MEDTR|nr:ABSCISIC ACID-INSENSITIVE 5-like protein 1 [Medicago truncatula]AES67058.1 bZIP transcription factor [Medicago truncatula]
MALQQLDQEVPLQEQEATFSQPSKQTSILSLTLDEFQCKSGKSFSSLNMDEFLASIWSSNDEATTHTHNTKNVVTTQHTISQQFGNSFSVPPPICKKTVDEVWSEIHKNQQQFKETNNLKRSETLKKQQTLGEMSLEDFLVKAGVVQQSSALPFKNHNGNVSSNMRPLNIASCYGLRPSMGMGFSTQCVSRNGLATYQMLSHNNNLGVKDFAVEKCQSLTESSGCSNRKRIVEGPPEVVVERRQRRMLKNRESAARSRARRQAYTVELEAELNLLKEENEKLKQVLAEAESKRKQELLQRKHSTKAQKGAEKLRAMRRPISTTW